MNDRDALGEFGTHRDELERMATQMLGSAEEAVEALETTRRWLLQGHDAVEESTAAWLQTVTARTCRDMLRDRDGRRHPTPVHEKPAPERALADAVGVVLMAALDRLSASERLAFVLRDVLGVPVDEIATVIGHSPEETERLYRRARQHMHRLDADDVLPARGTGLRQEHPPG